MAEMGLGWSLSSRRPKAGPVGLDDAVFDTTNFCDHIDRRGVTDRIVAAGRVLPRVITREAFATCATCTAAPVSGLRPASRTAVVKLPLKGCPALIVVAL